MKVLGILKKYINQPDIFKSFIVSILAVQAFVSFGVFDFDSIIPYVYLLIFIVYFQFNWRMENRQKYAFLGGAAIFIILGLTENEMDPIQMFISAAGGGAAGVFVSGKQFDIFARSKIKTKVCGMIIVSILLYNFIAEKFWFFQRNITGCIVAAALVILYFTVCAYLEDIFEKKTVSKYGIAAGIIFGLFSTFGNIMSFEKNLNNYGITAGFIVSLVISFLSWFIIFYISYENFNSIFAGISFVKDRQKIKSGNHHSKKICIGLFSFSFILIFLCFLPYFLAFYPGVIEYDSWVQMLQVLGMPYSNHHPWLHTMIIKFIYNTGLFLFNSENRAVALYSCLTMSLLAFSFSCAVVYLHKKGVRIRYLLFLLLAYGLCPINGMYSINMWKDIPFAAVCLLIVILLAHMTDNLREGKRNLIEWIIFIPLSFCVCFLRTNGLYAWLLLAPFIIYFFKCQRRKALAAVFITILLAVIYKGPVFQHYDVKEPDIIESLSIPAQQIAAVIAYDGNITDSQKELLSNIISIEKIPENYLGSKGCSDDIKDLVREKNNQEYIAAHKVEFMKLWLELGWQNKYIYVKAFVDETGGYWYHKRTYHFIWATYINENGSGINRASQFSIEQETEIRNYLKNYEAHFWKYYGNGIFMYIFFMCLITAWRNKSRYLYLFILDFGLWATLLIATPVFADFRYAYAIFLTVPFLAYLTLADKPDME